MFGMEKISLQIKAGERLYNRNNLVNVDGTVRTGIYNKERLVFDLDGNVVEKTDRINYIIDGDYIDVQDTFVVAGGNIVVTADNLYGKGNLLAPGDTELTIINRSQHQLRINNLLVKGADQGGYLYYNGLAVDSAEKIKGINRDKFGFGGVVNLTVIAPGSVAVPQINIKNTYTPITGDGPNIDLTGMISNLSGVITVENAKGNINIVSHNGSVPIVLGETVNMRSGRDVIMEYVPGVRHTASEPLAIWNDIIEEFRKVTDDPKNFSNYGDPFDLTLRYYREIADGRSGSGALVAGNHLYLSAEYLNINGTIQSGLPDWSLTLDVNKGWYQWQERNEYMVR